MIREMVRIGMSSNVAYAKLAILRAATADTKAITYLYSPNTPIFGHALAPVELHWLLQSPLDLDPVARMHLLKLAFDFWLDQVEPKGSGLRHHAHSSLL
ncbi:MAG: hypothetical protein HYX68_27290 [Planctomycetes bacterium]|nr:hypothetical protein [Planctomycetota bacterium]